MPSSKSITLSLDNVKTNQKEQTWNVKSRIWTHNRVWLEQLVLQISLGILKNMKHCSQTATIIHDTIDSVVVVKLFKLVDKANFQLDLVSLALVMPCDLHGTEILEIGNHWAALQCVLLYIYIFQYIWLCYYFQRGTLSSEFAY